MSINCTCSVYRVYPDGIIEVADTIIFTPTQSDDNKYLLPELNLTLNESLEKYEISGIFLDEACINSATEDTDITDNLTLVGFMGDVSFYTMSLYVKLASKNSYTVT
jgi:hypothetical protein